MVSKSVTLRAGGFFDGIGGFLLACQDNGFEVVLSCEIEDFPHAVLKHHFPFAYHARDITKSDFSEFRGSIDLLCAGFPCQPYSVSGNRKGSEDDRALWPHTIRGIKEARPRAVLLENVAGLFSILQPECISEVESKEVDLFCGNHDYPETQSITRLQRRVIADILTDLDQAGYEVGRLEDGTPIVLCIPAAGVGACHQRDRVWIFAYDRSQFSGDSKNQKVTDASYPNSECIQGGGRTPRENPCSQCQIQERNLLEQPSEANCLWDVTNAQREKPSRLQSRTQQEYALPNLSNCNAANPCSERPQGHELTSTFRAGKRPPRPATECFENADWSEVAAALCSVDDGISTRLDRRALQEIGIRSAKGWKNASLKGYGNAVHRQLASLLIGIIKQTLIEFS